MKRYVFPLVAISLLQCTSAIAQKKRSDNPHAPGEDIYKHYKGTIGTKQVTMDLLYGYQGASNYGGSWYYSPDNVVPTKFYIREPASFEHNAPLTAREQPVDTSLAYSWFADDANMAAWNFTITDDKLKGRWKSADGKRNYNVELKEDYSSSTPLDIFVRSGASAEKDESGKAKRGVNIIGIKPAASADRQDAELINSEVVKLLGGNSANDLESYYTNYISKYVNDPAGKGTTIMVTPAYNDNNLLALKIGRYDRNGMETDNYLSLDMKSHKRLMPEDMLDIGSVKLSKMLESAARKKYGFGPGIPLSTWFVRDKITPTKNFYPGHKGFYFTYQAGELAKSRAVTLFLSYDQVEEMMPKGFRKRVG